MKARNKKSHDNRQDRLDRVSTLEQQIIEKKEQADTAEQRARDLRVKKEALEAELASVKTELAATDETLRRLQADQEGREVRVGKGSRRCHPEV